VLGKNSLGRAPEDRDALLVAPVADTVFAALPGLRSTRAPSSGARAAFDGHEPAG
jgi:hypothetical protein